MNRNYGKIENGHITYAPKVLTRAHGAIICPKASDYFIDGWLPIEDKMPPRKEGFEVKATGWMKCDDKIIMRYEQRALPKESTLTQTALEQPKRSLLRRCLKRLAEYANG